MRCSSHHSSGRKSASSRDSLPGGSPSTAAAGCRAGPARAHEQDRALAAALAQPAAQFAAASRLRSSRWSTWRTVAYAAVRAVNSSVTRDSIPTSSTTSTSSPGSITESPVGTKPPPSRRIEITSEPVRQPEVLDRAARRRQAVAHLELDDLEPLLGQVEQVDQPVLRHLVLDQAQDQVGGGDHRPHAEQLEVLEVARVVAARAPRAARRTSRATPAR